MPSYRARAYFCPAKSGQPGWIASLPVWWRSAEFFTKYQARSIDTQNPWYVDYGLLLTQGEAATWSREGWAAFASDPRSLDPQVIEEMQRWEDMLANASWVIVELFEWESGLD